MAGEEAQFDVMLGGTEKLPSSLKVASFVACRGQEIQIMKNSLITQSGAKLAFQTLPNHMRRRAMSHNVKRLPRRLRQIHLNQMKKSGMPAKQKRPSRKYRRRPRNLIVEYTKRSNKKYRWLQTHIWHAKRFHMVEKWGFKLPYHPCDKAFRACYRAMTQHCLLQDISYYNCVEITGLKDLIIQNIKHFCKPDGGLSIGAKAFIQGNREGELTLYESEYPQRAIGKVNFLWQPNCEKDVSKLWLWIHAAFYESLKSILIKCCNGVVLQELDNELSRFRLTGPLSNLTLHDALVTLKIGATDSQQTSFTEYGHNEQVANQCEYWNKIKNITSTSEVSPHLVLALTVHDPRLNLPKKRTKSLPDFKEYTPCDVPNNVAASPLWDEEFRKQSNENKLPDSQIADLRSKLLVPGSDLSQDGALVPIILVQRPGNKADNIGLGSGWDIILPNAWAKPFWIALVMRGARVGGLRESNSMMFEMGKSQFLQPDTIAGINEDIQTLEQSKEKFFKKPPNKRINYNKFKIASPFFCNWKLLIQEWASGVIPPEDFTVIRDRRFLNSIDLFLNSKTKLIPEYPKNCLIPVKLECEKRGSPSQFAIICLPKSNSDFKHAVVEPSCDDKLQLERKELRRAHQSLLKKMRKQRKAKLKSPAPEAYKEILTSYTKKIRALWLPEPTTIRNACSREVIGFMTKGGFSFSIGKSTATGYITSDCLPAMTNCRNRVLFRNTNSRQYQTAKLTVIVD